MSQDNGPETKHEFPISRAGARSAMPTPGEVAERTAHYPEECQTAIRKFYYKITEKNWTLAEAAKQIPKPSGTGSIAPSTLSELINGKYPSPVGICQSMRRTLHSLAEYALMNDIGFVETRLAKAIHTYCDHAFTNRLIAQIYGRTFDGKTTALEAFSNNFNKGYAVYFRVPAGLAFGTMLNVLLQSLGYDNTRRSVLCMRQEVFRVLTPQHFLIFDEFHQIFTTYNKGNAVKIVEFLRELQDTIKFGMVYCGTQTAREQLLKGPDALLYKQTMQRSPGRLDTTKNKPQDFRPGFGKGGRKEVSKIAGHFGLPEPDEESYQLVKKIVSEESTGRFFQTCNSAKNRARNLSSTPTWDDFHEAHATFGQFSN